MRENVFSTELPIDMCVFALLETVDCDEVHGFNCSLRTSLNESEIGVYCSVMYHGILVDALKVMAKQRVVVDVGDFFVEVGWQGGLGISVDDACCGAVKSYDGL